MLNNILDVTTLVHLTIDKFSSEHESWWHSRAANKPDWKVRGIRTGFEYLSGQPPRVGRVYWQRIGVCASAKWNRRCRSSSFTQQKQHRHRFWIHAAWNFHAHFYLPCAIDPIATHPRPRFHSPVGLRDRFLNSPSKSIQSKILNSKRRREKVCERGLKKI